MTKSVAEIKMNIYFERLTNFNGSVNRKRNGPLEGFDGNDG